MAILHKWPDPCMTHKGKGASNEANDWLIDRGFGPISIHKAAKPRPESAILIFLSGPRGVKHQWLAVEIFIDGKQGPSFLPTLANLSGLNCVGCLASSHPGGTGLDASY
ncbi:hypothetical protein FOXYSP1_06175 [Fusarium oxysporum f. sp. phaseoli]